MPEDKSELLQYYRTTREALLAALDGLTDDSMTEPSLDGWSVKDHLVHLAAWDEIRASEVERISAGHDSAWRMSGDQDDTYNELATDLRRGLSLEQARWEVETSRRRLLDAISAASTRGLDASLYGEAPIRSSHEGEHVDWIRRWRGERGLRQPSVVLQTKSRRSTG
jgi:uncharacterized damage-inducible protein DinB